MSGNPLVVQDSGNAGFDLGDGFNNATNGMKMIDGAADAAAAFKNGDWIEGGIMGMSAGLDVVGAILDPIGTIGSMIAGFLIEHLGPVQDALDELCGDPGAIDAASATWSNVATHLSTVSSDLRSTAAHATGDMSGLAIDAYRSFSSAEADMIKGMSTVADGVSGGIHLGGTVLAGVRDFISGALADVCGQVVKLIGETFLTAGLMAGHATSTAVNKCRELIEKARKLMKDLARSLDRFGQLAGRMSPALEDAARAGSRVAARAADINESELDLLVSMSKAGSQDDDGDPNHL